MKLKLELEIADDHSHHCVAKNGEGNVLFEHHSAPHPQSLCALSSYLQQMVPNWIRKNPDPCWGADVPQEAIRVEGP